MAEALTSDTTSACGWFSKRERMAVRSGLARDLLMRDLREAGMVKTLFQISGTGPTLLGRNGEGDPYYTDGEIDMASLVVDGVRRTEPPEILPPPPLIVLKDQIWHGVDNAVSQ
jgi:hypothetical protein